MKQCRHPTCGDICRRPKKEKKNHKFLRRTPIRKVSKKQQKILGEKKLQSEKDKEFFNEIWQERDHFCYESGEYLGEEPLTVFFHHILPKADYDRFRYCKWNIVLLTWENHSKAEVNLDFVPKVKALYEKLYKKYSSLKTR